MTLQAKADQAQAVYEAGIAALYENGERRFSDAVHEERVLSLLAALPACRMSLTVSSPRPYKLPK